MLDMAYSITDAAANGNINLVNKLLEDGCDVNEQGRDGMTALSISSFWGYTDIVSALLKHGADVNAVNNGTLWTPLHCASFQGHGPVVLNLLRAGAQTNLPDADGRTPADFASAIDAIWPLLAAAGCSRTSKQQLIEKKIIVKSPQSKLGQPMNRSRQLQNSYLSRPGSAYVLMTERIHQIAPVNTMSYQAAIGGDVLANDHVMFSSQMAKWE